MAGQRTGIALTLGHIHGQYRTGLTQSSTLTTPGPTDPRDEDKAKETPISRNFCNLFQRGVGVGTGIYFVSGNHTLVLPKEKQRLKF